MDNNAKHTSWLGKGALALALVLGLAACNDKKSDEDIVVTDQCKRAELFAQCMERLPKGPERVATSNDWDEVVDACNNAALYQAKRRAPYVKPECRL